MKRLIYTCLIGIMILFLPACTGTASEGEVDYETTKKMVVDILQTEEGKRALAEILTDDEMKQELVIQSDVVRDSVTESLSSDKASQMWNNLFKDPAFVKGYATSMEEEQKKLMKDLMNDADYQKQMLDLMQNPEVTNQMLDVLKSQQFRAHLQETIEQTLETPLFQAKIQEILMLAAEKQGQENNGQSNGAESNEGETRKSEEEENIDGGGDS